MNKDDMFDKLFENKGFSVYHDGEKLARYVCDDGSVDYVDEDTDDTMITISNDKICCTECDCKIGYSNCEVVNDHSINLICPDCLYEYKVLFSNVDKIPMSKDIKALLDGSIYEALLENQIIHVKYSDGKFLCIEENDKPVKPEMLNKEVFLSNAQLADLRKEEKSCEE